MKVNIGLKKLYKNLNWYNQIKFKETNCETKHIKQRYNWLWDMYEKKNRIKENYCLPIATIVATVVLITIILISRGS